MEHRLGPHRTIALDAAQRLEALALAATIPAFYLAMLVEHRTVAVSLYLLACAASTWAASRPATTRAGSRAHPGWQHRGLGGVLAVLLLLSALLPAGEAFAVVAVRLAAALLGIVRVGESLRPWFWRGGLLHLLGVAVAVLGLCGLGFWWLEPHAHSFGDGLWLAFTTAATVGYGDIVPTTPAAKIFAVFVVLLGFAVLSLVTAAIAAMWVQSEERRIEHEILHDLHQQLKQVREELHALRRQHAAAARPPDEDARAPSARAAAEG